MTLCMMHMLSSSDRLLTSFETDPGQSVARSWIALVEFPTTLGLVSFLLLTPDSNLEPHRAIHNSQTITSRASPSPPRSSILYHRFSLQPKRVQGSNSARHVSRENLLGLIQARFIN